MPSDKRDTKNDVDEVPAEKRLARRTAVFGLVITLLCVVAVWFVASTFRNQESKQKVTLTASVEHTVKILEMGEDKKSDMKVMAQHPTLRGLTKGYEVHVKSLQNGRIALCAGRFDSDQSVEAKNLLKRITDYTRQGNKPFQSAELIQVAAGE